MTDTAVVTKPVEDRSEGRTPDRAKGRAGKGWLILVGFVAVDFVLGAVAGVYAGAFFGGSDQAAESSIAHSESEGAGAEAHAPEPAGTRTEVEVGRITVVIPSDGPEGGNIHLLITPLVVGYPEAAAEAAESHGAEGEAPAGPTAELRDAFIEYLSQLHETEVRGSLGLATLRAELLRRSRTVAPDLMASAVLIQEFLIQ